MSVAFDANGLLASGSIDNTIKLWNTATGTMTKTLAGHTSFVSSLAFDNKGLLASGSWDKTIKLWNTATGTLVNTLQDPNDVNTSQDPENINPVAVRFLVVSLAFDNKGLLASGQSPGGRAYGVIKLWNTATGKLINTLQAQFAVHRSPMAFDSKGLLASGSYDGKIKLWNTTTGTLINNNTLQVCRYVIKQLA